jgi:hypothetical protein
MKRSVTLRRQQRDIEEFAQAFSGLLEVTQPEERYFAGNSRWFARPEDEAEAQRRYATVSAVAGKAAVALQATGMNIGWKPRGQPPGYSQPVNPALAWTTVFSDDPMFGADLILTVCDQAIGVLDSQGSEAEEHEQSFEGKVAHAAGFLERVRPPGRSHRAGVVQGSAATIVCGVIVGYILHALGWV